MRTGRSASGARTQKRRHAAAAGGSSLQPPAACCASSLPPLVDALARLSVRQLELDAAVAAQHLFAGPLLERLEFAVTGSHQALGRYAPADQVLHHGSRARTGELPIRGELRRG